MFYVSLFIYASIHLSIHLFIYVCTCLCISLCFYRFIRFFVYVFWLLTNYRLGGFSWNADFTIQHAF